MRGLIGVGDIDGARTAQAELEAHRESGGNDFFKAAAGLAAGRVALAVGDATKRADDSKTPWISTVRAAHPTNSACQDRVGAGPRCAGTDRQAPQEAQRRDRSARRTQGGTRTLASPRARSTCSKGERQSRARPAGLTARELEVLRLVAGGSTMHRLPNSFLSASIRCIAISPISSANSTFPRARPRWRRLRGAGSSLSSSTGPFGPFFTNSQNDPDRGCEALSASRYGVLSVAAKWPLNLKEEL